MLDGSCHECHRTNKFSSLAAHLNYHIDQLNVSFPSLKPQSLNFVQNILIPILIMHRLVSKFVTIISNVLLTILEYYYAEFLSPVRMISCHQLSSGSKNKHHEFLGHARIFQLAKFKFIAGFQCLPIDGHNFEFSAYQVHFSS